MKTIKINKEIEKKEYFEIDENYISEFADYNNFNMYGDNQEIFQAVVSGYFRFRILDQDDNFFYIRPCAEFSPKKLAYDYDEIENPENIDWFSMECDEEMTGTCLEDSFLELKNYIV